MAPIADVIEIDQICGSRDGEIAQQVGAGADKVPIEPSTEIEPTLTIPSLRRVVIENVLAESVPVVVMEAIEAVPPTSTVPEGLSERLAPVNSMLADPGPVRAIRAKEPVVSR